MCIWKVCLSPWLEKARTECKQTFIYSLQVDCKKLKSTKHYNSCCCVPCIKDVVFSVCLLLCLRGLKKEKCGQKQHIVANWSVQNLNSFIFLPLQVRQREYKCCLGTQFLPILAT